MLAREIVGRAEGLLTHEEIDRLDRQTKLEDDVCSREHERSIRERQAEAQLEREGRDDQYEFEFQRKLDNDYLENRRWHELQDRVERWDRRRPKWAQAWLRVVRGFFAMLVGAVATIAWIKMGLPV